MEFISVYGLFLAKVATVVLAIAALPSRRSVWGNARTARKGLQLTDLGEQYREMQRDMRRRVWIPPSRRSG